MTLEVGYDGHKPEFVQARDVEGRDPLTGKLRRFSPAGPQNVNVDRIEYMFAHRQIVKRQYDAANRLMEDDYLAHTAVVASAVLDRICGNSCDDSMSVRERAGRRYKRAQNAFFGWRAVLWPFVDFVALRNVSIDDVGNLMRADKRVAKAHLRTGLHILADAYGLDDS